MSTPTTSILAKKPISALQKPLKADAKGLFKGLLKATAHGASGKWEDLAPDAGEIITSMGLKTTPEELAWLLIYRSLQQALFDLVSPNFHLLPKEADTKMEAISEGLDEALTQSELSIDEDFFRYPQKLEILATLQLGLKNWLMNYGVEEARANTIVARLPVFFTHALHQEWKRHPAAYGDLQKTSPFSGALKREAEWDAYYAWLHQQVDESLLQETFSLKQVYVSLRAYYLREKLDTSLSDVRRVSGRDKGATRVIFHLQKQMEDWLQRANKKDALRIISGGPGSGKSSFMKIWAACLTERTNIRVVFVPLHLFNPKDSLESAMSDFIRREGFLSENPLNSDGIQPRLLLLFDGLDELSMRGKLSEEVARNFVREVEKTLTQCNQQKLQVQAVISGREVVIQANSAEFRNEGEVVHVLSYHEQPRENDENEDLLTQDQRVEWWKKYGNATGKGYEDLPERLQGEDLTEITAQPLLNYLVALSYEGKTYKEGSIFDFSGEVSLNLIYKDLLAKVYARGWEGGRSHPATQDLKEEQFCRVLEEIALAAWHGNGRTTTISEIENHCERSGLSPLLKRFEEGAKVGVTRLLAAFYFRQFGNEPSGDPTFEFTHKSFGEYLIARRIVRALSRIEDELRRHENFEGGWDEINSLKHWAEICGPSSLNRSILNFLREEVALYGDARSKEWQKLLCRLILIVLRRGMPMEMIVPRQNYRKEDEQARNAEETLLAALNASALVTKEVSRINWPESNSASAWITRMQGTRPDKSFLAVDCLGYLDLSEVDLGARDFFSADFVGADLSYADLSGVNLRGAILTNVDLSNANLDDADLTDADFCGANLTGANLTGVRLNHANLSYANLDYVNLSYVNLKYATLIGANFRGADLRDADFEGANLET